MAMKEAFFAEFDHEMATTRKLLERVPEDRLAWKPHERSMSLGGLAQHVANIPHWSTVILKQREFDQADAPPRLAEPHSRAEILQLFERTTKEARAAMDISDPEWMAPWTFKQSGHEVFTLPKAAALRGWVMNHGVHHRGQLSVYLRMLNVPLPAMYGPSADEAQ